MIHGVPIEAPDVRRAGPANWGSSPFGTVCTMSPIASVVTGPASTRRGRKSRPSITTPGTLCKASGSPRSIGARGGACHEPGMAAVAEGHSAVAAVRGPNVAFRRPIVAVGREAESLTRVTSPMSSLSRATRVG